MGICSSCCRRRSKEKDPEREPLLKKRLDDVAPSRSQLERVADVVAALNAGKLPTQHQIDSILVKALNSETLDVGAKASHGALNAAGKDVLEGVKEVLDSLLQIGLEKNYDNALQDLIYQVRSLESVPVHVNAASDAGDEVKQLASSLPTKPELKSDTQAFITSLRTLLFHLLTSAALRVVLGDFMLITREFVASAAANVANVAAQVEATATIVETNVRPDGDAPDATDPESEVTVDMGKHITDKLSPRDVFMDRLEDILRKAHSDPSIRTSLLTLLHILEKYYTKATLAASTTESLVDDAQTSLEASEAAPEPTKPAIEVDEPVHRALRDFKALVTRFASGRSLDRLISLLGEVKDDVLGTESGEPGKSRRYADVVAGRSADSAYDYFCAVSGWLRDCLKSKSFVESRTSRVQGERLYDDGMQLLNSNSKLSTDVNAMMSEVGDLVEAFKTDRTTTKLIKSIDDITQSIRAYGETATSEGKRVAQNWKQDLTTTLIRWVLPRLLRSLHALPLPRVELQTPDIDLAVDSVVLTALGTSLLPDMIRVQNWSEVRIDVGEWDEGSRALVAGAGAERVRSATRVRIHVEGLRVQAQKIAYYACYKRWYGYEDEGLLGVDMGHDRARGEGLKLDIELETGMDADFGMNSEARGLHQNGNAGTEEMEDDRKVFRIVDVRTDVPGLAFQIDKSKHWILNKTLQPFLGPVVRTVTRWVLAKQVWGLLEGVEGMMRKVRDGAKERADEVAKDAADRRKEEESEEEGAERGPAVDDYVHAFMRTIGVYGQVKQDSDKEDADTDEEDAENQDEDPNAPLIETHTTPTAKGIVRTTVTQSSPAASRPPTPQESKFAVGLGAQILPGRANFSDEVPGPRDVAREGLAEVQAKVDEGVETAGVAAEQSKKKGEEVSGDLEAAQRRAERRGFVERRKKGWKSDVFNF